MAKKNKEESIFYPTGSDLLDLVVGGGKGYGYEGGHIINLVGDKSSGKTGLAVEMIAAMVNKFNNVKWNYNDAESGFTFDTKSLYGFDIMKNSSKTSTVEDLYCDARNFFESIKENEIGIYVLDSLDGLTSIEMKKRADKRYKYFKQNKDFDKGSYQMDKAKFLSQEFFPLIAQLIENKNAFLVIISQTRDKIGSMFKTKTRAGGKALDFYCHTILWLREVNKITNKGIVTQILIEALTKKNKTARPFRKCRLSFIFDYGIDSVGDNIDYLFDLRTDERGDLKAAAKNIVWDKDSKQISRSNILDFVKSDENIFKRYRDEKPYGDLKGQEKIDSIIVWIYSAQNKDIQEKYEKEFTGKTYTRDELIEWIEKDENRIKELTRRVREKWENIEQEVATKRKRKYS